MLFETRFADGIADGSVTLTFRRWKRRQVLPGHRYRTAAGTIEVDSLDVVEESAITDDEARRAGYPSAPALLADLRGGDLPLYRVAFHAVDDVDPRAAMANDADLSADDLAELERRLARLDEASASGAWTRKVLELIAARPGVRAAELAASLGRERLPFKADVRKLKNLGLTHSLEIGYRLSPRGEAYLQQPTDDGR